MKMGDKKILCFFNYLKERNIKHVYLHNLEDYDRAREIPGGNYSYIVVPICTEIRREDDRPRPVEEVQ